MQALLKETPCSPNWGGINLTFFLIPEDLLRPIRITTIFYFLVSRPPFGDVYRRPVDLSISLVVDPPGP